MKLASTTDDNELFLQIAEGNERAFEALFRKYLPRLRPFITGFVKVEAVSDEILQDIFLKIWANRTQLTHVSNPCAWIYKISTNLAIDHLRRQAAEYKALKVVAGEEGRQADDLFGHLTARELQQFIYDAVHSLPEQRRKIYILVKESGWSHREVADHLGISVQTVKNQIVSALKAIQTYIIQSGGVYIPLILLILKKI